MLILPGRNRQYSYFPEKFPSENYPALTDKILLVFSALQMFKLSYYRFWVRCLKNGSAYHQAVGAGFKDSFGIFERHPAVYFNDGI